jgi:hypothetical protein
MLLPHNFSHIQAFCILLVPEMLRQEILHTVGWMNSLTHLMTSASLLGFGDCNTQQQTRPKTLDQEIRHELIA